MAINNLRFYQQTYILITICPSFLRSTLLGDVCLKLPLTSAKKSFDGRPKYIFSALILVCTICMFFMRIKMNKIINCLCLSKTSFACLGGKRQRNILTFNQLLIYFSVHVFFFNLDNFNNFIYYRIGYLFSSQIIFLITILPSVIFKHCILILLPLGLLMKTKTTFPQIWTDCPEKKLEFKVIRDPLLIPRRTV